MGNDLNNDQAVTDQNQDLNNADSVDQQNLADDQVVQDQTQDNVLADGTPDNKDVPYDRFKEANEKAKVAEQGRQDAENRLLMIQNQQMQQTQQQAVAPKTVEEQVLQDMGIEADDLFGANVMDFQKRVGQKNNQITQQNNAAFANQQFMQTHPDVSQVVGSVNPATGQFMASAELAAVLQEKPHLAGACNSVEGAYNVVMEARELAKLRQTGQITAEHQTRQGVDTSIAPLGGSAAGGGGAGTQQGQGMLSRDQVAEINAKRAAGHYR